MRQVGGFDSRRKALAQAISADPDAYYSLYVECTGKQEPNLLEVEDYVFNRAISLVRSVKDGTIHHYVEREHQPIFSNLAGLTYTERFNRYCEESHKTEGFEKLRLTDLGKRVVKIIEPKQRKYVHKLMGL